MTCRVYNLSLENKVSETAALPVIHKIMLAGFCKLSKIPAIEVNDDSDWELTTRSEITVCYDGQLEKLTVFLPDTLPELNDLIKDLQQAGFNEADYEI